GLAGVDGVGAGEGEWWVGEQGGGDGERDGDGEPEAPRGAAAARVGGLHSVQTSWGGFELNRGGGQGPPNSGDEDGAEAGAGWDGAPAATAAGAGGAGAFANSAGAAAFGENSDGAAGLRANSPCEPAARRAPRAGAAVDVGRSSGDATANCGV